MPSIHPSAIVEDGATLADDVKIGPQCYIGAEVTIGEGTTVGGKCQIINRVEIGRNNRLHYSVALGDLPQEHEFNNPQGKVIIGDNNIFREFTNVHLPSKKESTKIGSDCFFMVGAHVAHDCEIGDRVIMVNNSGLAGHAVIGDGALISGLVMVHQFCRVGDYAVIGGCSKLAGDMPPYFMANGSPAKVYGLNRVGLKRNGFSAAARKRISEVFHILYNSGLPVPKAAAQVAERFAKAEEEGDVATVTTKLLDFLAVKGRPIIRGSRSSDKDGEN